jgi:hypothetical protein
MFAQLARGTRKPVAQSGRAATLTCDAGLFSRASAARGAGAGVADEAGSSRQMITVFTARP